MTAGLTRAARVAFPLLLLQTRPAAAHLVQSGLGGFYDGLLHPLVSVGELLPLLALALWAGLRGAGFARWLVLAVPLAWLVGYALAGSSPPGRSLVLAAGVAGVVLGVLGAANARVPLAALLVAGVALGLVQGLMLGREGSDLGAVGSALTVGCVIAILGGEVAALRVEWTRIAARVLASWTAAVGLLQLGWMLRG